LKISQEIRKRPVFKPWDRHGLILTTVGVSYILISIVLLLSDQSTSGLSNVKDILAVAPYPYWCGALIVVGCASILSAILNSIPRTLGYVVLTGWSTFWAGVHIIGGLSYPMDLSYVSLGMIWALMAFLWWAISGLLSPPKEKEDPP